MMKRVYQMLKDRSPRAAKYVAASRMFAKMGWGPATGLSRDEWLAIEQMLKVEVAE